MNFSPGALVTARGRDWVVLAHDAPELVMVRPLGGTDDETTGILTAVEAVEPASFGLPDPALHLGDAHSARLLRDALRLGFRSGAGPFRSVARIGCDPRPYQLVPLLMALRLDPVRLLIADDVGVGKTIEAALVASELAGGGRRRPARRSGRSNGGDTFGRSAPESDYGKASTSNPTQAGPQPAWRPRGGLLSPRLVRGSSG